jgi:hypothetical protein
MPESSTVRKIYKWKPLTSRPVGRPKSLWGKDVRNYLIKVNLLKWTEKNKIALNWTILLRKQRLSQLQHRRRKRIKRSKLKRRRRKRIITRNKHSNNLVSLTLKSALSKVKLNHNKIK